MNSSLHMEPTGSEMTLEQASIAIASAGGCDELSEVAVKLAHDLIGCQGAIFFVRVDKDLAIITDDHLDYKAISFPSLDMFYGGISGSPIPIESIPMFDSETGDLYGRYVAVKVADSCEVVNIGNIKDASAFDFSDFKDFDAKTEFSTKSVLSLPLPNRQGFSRGVLQLVNYVNPGNGAVETFPDELVEKASVLAKLVALSLDKILVHEQMITTGIALSAERNPDRLLERILLEAKALANADGGTLYLKTAENTLNFAIVRNDSLNIALGGTTGKEITFPALNMYDQETGEPNNKNVATHVALSPETINIEDAYNATGFDFSGTKKFDEGTGYRSKSFLTVPLQSYQGDVIGVLQLINAMDPKGTPVPFDNYIQPIVEAMASQAAVALDNQLLIAAQKQLFQSFVGTLAEAIDAKSPYTGGHCVRVPVIAGFLADAAQEQKDGPYADFNLNEEEMEELMLAANLHDCGKVTTPEYIVDKATKLETIFNRIHEVRARFEILRRDVEIEYLKMVSEGGDEEILKDAFDTRCKELEEQFEFVATCNVGGEFFDDEKVENLKEIGEQTYTRYFDRTLGLSEAEKLNIKEMEAPQTPGTEMLLSDRSYQFYGKYNQGEIYNLSISRGTLTSEERETINDHVVVTKEMLTRLPFPRYLAKVPEYAGGHHEKMDGTGYPDGLTGDQLSIPARMMAIADVFEALTATDRPYKPAKKLSVAIKIMSFMKKDNHIDPELFDLFLTSGVYQKYADTYLKPEQIDEVDISQYLTKAEAAE